MPTSTRSFYSTSSSTDVQITLYTSFDESEPDWRSVTAQCASYGFQTFEWLSAWHSAIGSKEGISPNLIFVKNPENRILMFLPLGIRRRYWVQTLEFLGGDVTDYNAPVIDRDYASSLERSAFKRLWADILRCLPKIDLINFQRMPEIIGGIRNPLCNLQRTFHSSTSYYFDVSSGSLELIRRDHKNLSRYIAKRRRQLSKIGPLIFRLHDQAAERASIVNSLIEQQKRHARETGRFDLFSKDGYAEFYGTVATCPFKSGAIHVSSLTVGDCIVATLFALVHEGRLCALLLGREGEPWARYSPGSILLDCITEWSVSKGIKIFDLTYEGENFKKRWTNMIMQLYNTRHAIRLRGTIFLLILKRYESLIGYRYTRPVAFYIKQVIRRWYDHHTR